MFLSPVEEWKRIRRRSDLSKVTLIVAAVIGQAWKLLGDHKYKKMMKKWLQQYPVFETLMDRYGLEKKLKSKTSPSQVLFFIFYLVNNLGTISFAA